MKSLASNVICPDMVGILEVQNKNISLVSSGGKAKLLPWMLCVSGLNVWSSEAGPNDLKGEGVKNKVTDLNFCPGLEIDQSGYPSGRLR